MKPSNLEGRIAWCDSDAWNPPPFSGHNPKPSSKDLPFFQYMGEGSDSSFLCAICTRTYQAHIEYPDRLEKIVGKHEYTPRGSWNYDLYTCTQHISD